MVLYIPAVNPFKNRLSVCFLPIEFKILASPSLCRWSAWFWPDETPTWTFSPSPPWSLGCDPRRSRGKAWLPVLGATCERLLLPCSPPLPYTVDADWCAAGSAQRIQNANSRITSRPAACKGNWKHRRKKNWGENYNSGSMGGTTRIVGRAPACSFVPECLSSRLKIYIHSPTRWRGKRGVAAEWPKIMTQASVCFCSLFFPPTSKVPSQGYLVFGGQIGTACIWEPCPICEESKACPAWIIW